jgi:uncharacterized protein involved in exopolysaccharide biosynthesis
VKNLRSRLSESRGPAAAPPETNGSPPPPPEAVASLDRDDQPTSAIFEPPSNFVLEAIRFHKLLVLAFAVAGVLIGTGLGLLREPVYTASATLQVGEVNPNSPGFGGYTQSATSLATGFSRAIVAGPVLARVQRKLGLAPTEAAPRLSAEPIPLSPVFRVIATGRSESGALKLANVTATGVVAYVTKANSGTPQANELLRAYRDGAIDVRRAKARQVAVEGDESASAAELQRSEAALSTAQVKLEALSRSYVASVTSQAPRAGLVSVLAGATTASDDRKSKLELYAFVGLLIGLLLGCVAAIWRERRLPPLESDRGELVPRPR